MVRGGSEKGDQDVLQGDHTHPKRHDFGIRHFRNLRLLRTFGTGRIEGERLTTFAFPSSQSTLASYEVIGWIGRLAWHVKS